LVAVIAHHLNKRAGFHCRVDVACPVSQDRRCQLFQSSQFISIDIANIALRKAMNKDSEVAGPINNDDSKASGFAFALSRNALLDDATPEIRVDQATLKIEEGDAKLRIVDSALSRESRKRLVFEDAASALHLGPSFKV